MTKQLTKSMLKGLLEDFVQEKQCEDFVKSIQFATSSLIIWLKNWQKAD